MTSSEVSDQTIDRLSLEKDQIQRERGRSYECDAFGRGVATSEGAVV